MLVTNLEPILIIKTIQESRARKTHFAPFDFLNTFTLHTFDE